MHEQLENIIIEIKKPNSVPIFVCTWYRPPGSPIELFEIFESAVEKVDAMKGELYVLGDLNCDLLAKSYECHTKRLLELCELYNLSQLINVPTRITLHSEALIDLCLTTAPEKISVHGVIRTG